MNSPAGLATSGGACPDSDSEWAARAYGVRFRLKADDPARLETLVARVPPGTRPSRISGSESFCCSMHTPDSVTGSPAVWRVCLGEEVQSVAASESSALDAFESVLRFEVARRAPRWTFVHAGAVGWRGRIILIPGKSFSGKSTLVRALVQAGATYYSDEYAVLDQRGLVYPFAQPLTQRTGAGTRKRLSITELGGTTGTQPQPVGLIVATRFEPGGTWAPRSLSPGEGLLAMLANTVRAQAAPFRVLRSLARVAESSPAIKSVRGDANLAAAELLSRHAIWQFHRRSIA